MSSSPWLTVFLRVGSIVSELSKLASLRSWLSWDSPEFLVPLLSRLELFLRLKGSGSDSLAFFFFYLFFFSSPGFLNNLATISSNSLASFFSRCPGYKILIRNFLARAWINYSTLPTEPALEITVPSNWAGAAMITLFIFCSSTFKF